MLLLQQLLSHFSKNIYVPASCIEQTVPPFRNSSLHNNESYSPLYVDSDLSLLTWQELMTVKQLAWNLWLNFMSTTVRYVLGRTWCCKWQKWMFTPTMSCVYLPQPCLLQLHALVVDKLVRMQIVDSMAVISWLFTPEVMPQFTR